MILLVCFEILIFLNDFDDLQGRDEVLLCSLSSFDAYFHTRPYKAPRPFSFAVKSTENLSLFENTADYLHIFSCAEKDGNIWMEKILLARVSFFLPCDFLMMSL